MDAVGDCCLGGLRGMTSCTGTSRARNAWYSWMVAISVAFVSQRQTGARRMNTPTGCTHNKQTKTVQSLLLGGGVCMEHISLQTYLLI